MKNYSPTTAKTSTVTAIMVVDGLQQVLLI